MTDKEIKSLLEYAGLEPEKVKKKEYQKKAAPGAGRKGRGAQRPERKSSSKRLGRKH